MVNVGDNYMRLDCAVKLAEPNPAAVTVQMLEKQLVHAKAAAIAESKRTAARERAMVLIDQCHAQLQLAQDIYRLVSSPEEFTPRAAYAKHKAALSVVAAKFGYKLVLVGNKNAATLVRA